MNRRLNTEQEQEQYEAAISTWTKFELLWKRLWASRHSTSGTGEERPQHDPSTSIWTRFGLRWKRVWTSMRSRWSTGGERPQLESSMQPCSTLTNGIQTSNPFPSNLCPHDPVQEPEKEESGSEHHVPSLSSSAQDPSFPSSQQEDGNHAPGDQPQSGSSPSSSTITHTGEDEEMVITDIRAKEPALGLRRLPAGFYTVVHHSGLKWRTENKCSSASDDVVEWSGPIPLPSDRSAIVYLEVYASFEFQPMLGIGERLRELTITVEQLLDQSANDIPFTLFPKNGEVVSPCSSILVVVKQRNGERSDSSASRVLGPLCSTTRALNELEDATNHGHSALSRYQKHGGKLDLERSVVEFERALNNCPLDHPCRAAAQSNLAMAKLILCQVEDTTAFLEIPIDLYRDALAARPVGHTDRPFTLVQLAAVHLARFNKQRDQVEVDRADTLLREAIELSSTESHESRIATFMLQLQSGLREGSVRDRLSLAEQDLPSCSADEDPWALVDQLMERFSQFSDLADLQQAIATLEDLIRSTPASDERYCTGLAKLSLALSYQFDHSGELSDLEKAISMSKGAVDLIPDGHPDKPQSLSNLGNCLADRFECLGDLSDLEKAISSLKVVVDLTPHHHPDKPDHLNNLASSFLARFERLGELSDIDEAISMLRDAVKLTPHGRPDDPVLLGSLGSSLYLRFMRLGHLSDLEEAIPLQKGAVELIPHDHPYKPGLLHNLGKSLKAHFERLGKLSYLEDAILTLRDAIKLTPCGHYGKPGRLDTLGCCLGTRFHQLGELSDLQDSIAMHKNAVALTPRAHPERPTHLSNLGSTFYLSFTRFGEMDDLKDAISIQREAVDLTPLGHPDKPGRMNNLANSFLSRFERLGELSDIEHAISMLRSAVNLTPVDHPLKANLLTNLGIIFFHRFVHLRELDDLEDAIMRQRDAVDLTPYGHPNKPSILSHLGNSLITRFERIGEPSDLEDAISKQRDAVSLTPHSHPAKPSYFNNLGNCLRNRFHRFGEQGDLEEAVSMLKAAVDLTPPDHPHKSPHLRNLGQCLVARFRHVKELGDLDSAILMLREAATLVPHGHLQKPAHLYFLAATYKTRFNHTGKTSDIEQAITLFSYAATIPIGPVHIRFGASQSWISCARLIHHHTLLQAYSVSISLLPQLAWIGLSLTQRYMQLAENFDVVRDAAAAALDSGLPETAVEWLEQGRSILWGELFQLRSSYEELSPVHPDYATRLRELSVALEHAGVTRERSSPTLSEPTKEPLQHEIDKHRTLASERDKLLREIRRLPGFERFLLHKEFSQLRGSAHSGPIVILNAAETRCDALILLDNVDHPLHVPLPDFTFNRSTHLQNILKGFVRRAGVTRHDRVGKVETADGVTWESILSPLWRCVVKPVLDALAISTPGDLSRIFWCPTGPFVFFPFHAAGFYGTQHSRAGHKVYDFVVSSYIPTIATLGLSPNLVTAPTSDLRLLAVRQPSSDGQFRLPGVHTELEYIKDVIRDSPSARTILVESSTGTIEEVLGMMKESDWVHFACHGIQDASSPIDSGLCLADKRRLRLRDIIALSRPHGGLAFLSACQTAMGDKHLSDEALHISAGMLFAGYKGVVGTMWSISDKLAPGVARDVYGQLFASGTKPDYREAARALHDAIGSLRDTGEVSFDEWIPFIHIGL